MVQEELLWFTRNCHAALLRLVDHREPVQCITHQIPQGHRNRLGGFTMVQEEFNYYGSREITVPRFSAWSIIANLRNALLIKFHRAMVIA